MKRKATITAVVAGALMISGFASANWPRCESGHAHLFALFDTDGDGMITRAEADAAAAARFEQADADGSGTLSSAELAAARTQRIIARAKERAQRFADTMVERHDRNEDGVLSSDELPLSRVDRLFEHLDADSDATITAEEVRNARHNRRDRREGGWHGRPF